VLGCILVTCQSYCMALALGDVNESMLWGSGTVPVFEKPCVIYAPVTGRY